MGLLYHIVCLYMSEQCVPTCSSIEACYCLSKCSLNTTLEHLILSIIHTYTSRYRGAPGQGGPHYAQKIYGTGEEFYETVYPSYKNLTDYTMLEILTSTSSIGSKPVSTPNTFSRGSPLPTRNSMTQAVKEYLVAQCGMC
jgi:hypothetical protein